ncbi:MAG: penicillin-binding protein 2 [Phycisphaerales bacterium]|nr:MAG: penicillin-binding protein 2 [Phycisphaerales bacterium]
MKSVRVIIFFMVLIVAAFLALAWRCFQLQYYQGDHYSDVCLQQKRGYSPQLPRRGVVLDCRGRVLAASNAIRVIFAEPRTIKDPKETSNSLAPILDMGAHEICKLIVDSGNSGFARIKTGAEPSQCTAASRLRGIGVQYDWRRHYPMGRLAPHVVGFTSVDNRGLGGIEFQYDAELRGTPARSVFLADVYRRPIHRAPVTDDLETGENVRNGLAVDGHGIILTLDAAIQQFVRAELLKQYESYEAESALAVVADPKTGAILAMVSLPDFDSAEARHADPNMFCNHAITDQYEPGSIFKPVVAAIALDVGVVNRQEKIFCENGNYRGKGFGRIGEYRRGFGDLTVREILAHSSNIGMAKIGQRLGKERLHEGLELFGFGKKVGIELPGEAKGSLWPTSQWNGYSITRIPFGQEVSVTAIQLVRAFCILANEGRVVQPHLVKATVDATGSMTDARPRTLGLGYIVKRDIAKWIVTEAMVGVVNEGTGTRAKLEKWQVFGKSGTGQLAKSDGGGYAEDAYVASFVAGAPAEDPRIVVLVSIRKPNVELGKGYTGGVVAAPVAGAIVQKTLEYLESLHGPAPRQVRRRDIALGLERRSADHSAAIGPRIDAEVATGAR